MAEHRGLNFFSEPNVLERFKRPANYFERISTVAFKPVSSYKNHNVTNKIPCAFKIQISVIP